MFKPGVCVVFLLAGMRPLGSSASCDGLADILISNYPNRVFVEYLRNDDVYAVYEPSISANKSTITMFSCVDNEHLKITEFPFFVRVIDDMEVSEDGNRLFVIFKYETEQYGWI